MINRGLNKGYKSVLLEVLSSLVEGLSSLLVVVVAPRLAALLVVVVVPGLVSSLLIVVVFPVIVSSFVEAGLSSLLEVGLSSLVEVGFSSLLEVGLASLRFSTLVWLELRLGSIMLDMLLRRSFNFFVIIVFVFFFLIIIVFLFLIINIIIEVFIFKIFEIFVFIVVRLFLNLLLLGGCLCWHLSLLLRGLGFLLGRHCFGGGFSWDCKLGGWLDLNLLVFIFFFLVGNGLQLLLSKGEISLLVGLKETGHVKDSISFDNEGDFIEQGDEDIDGGMGLVLVEGGEQELGIVLLDPEGSGILGGGGPDDVGKGEDLALGGFCLVRAELVGLSLSQDFSKEHDC